MLFQSLEYLLLLVSSILLIRFVNSNKIKKLLIVALNALFYAYGGGWQILLFVGVVIYSYITARILEKHKSKILFSFTLFIAFLPLITYKYVPFFISEIFGMDNSGYISIFVLPIGISFYTFQLAGYLIDVYRGKTKAVRSLITLSCFISFFPQLIAGPIERAESLVQQIERFDKPSKEDYSQGFRYILLGLCLKLLVAETMAGFVNPVFNNIYSKNGLAILIATICFGIQIYCDFNGYTLMAIGSARLMNIKLMKNFDHPYNAISVSDFWRRWHISLTTWFRDYVYIPLGGNRKGKVRTTINSLITFTLSGIWHGANWTFLMWGFINGLFISIEKLFNTKKIQGLYSVFTFCIVNLLWIFFRANTLSDAFFAFKQIFTKTFSDLLNLTSIQGIMSFYFGNGWNRFMIFPFVFSIIMYFLYEYGKFIKFDLLEKMNSPKPIFRWSVYTIIIAVTLYFGQIIEQSAFVYFRF